MFADIVLAGEQFHLALVLLWAGMSIMAGTAILTAVHWRLRDSLLLRRFGQVTLIWGTALLVIGAVGWMSLGLRDHGSAARLASTLRASAVIDAGAIVLGATVAAVSWRRGRGAGGMGAGAAVILQGVVLLALHLQLLRVLAA